LADAPAFWFLDIWLAPKIFPQEVFNPPKKALKKPRLWPNSKKRIISFRRAKTKGRSVFKSLKERSL
jgi:hypothetical protein